MKTLQTLPKAMGALAVGIMITSILPPSAALKSNVDNKFRTPLLQLLRGSVAPALAMAQTLVEGKGKVIAVTQEKQELVLEHGEIRGFMDAMTMGYKVSSPSMLKGLKAGDEVRFTIDKNKSVITNITKVKPDQNSQKSSPGKS